MSPPRRGDNTFSNYQEAQRAFWRSTVLPLFNRTAKALAGWLAPAWGETLQLRGDLDQIDALTMEREALWARLQGTSFLTDDEQRSAIGYGPMPVEAPTPEAEFGTPDTGEERFNPYHDELGRFTNAEGDAGGFTASGPSTPEIAQMNEGVTKPPVVLAAGRGKGGEAAGKIAKEVMKYSVRKFVSSYCKGEINRELPNEFEDYTLEDLWDLAKGGDARARKCKKLLQQDRFRK